MNIAMSFDWRAGVAESAAGGSAIAFAIRSIEVLMLCRQAAVAEVGAEAVAPIEASSTGVLPVRFTAAGLDRTAGVLTAAASGAGQLNYSHCQSVLACPTA